MPKREKVKGFSIRAFDAAHYRLTEEYTRAVDLLFNKATDEIAEAASKGNYNPDKPFAFNDYPKVQTVMQQVTKQLADRMTAVIESGSKKQWLYACKKNDGFIASIFDTSKISKARLKKMQDQNLDALKAFQERKVNGMQLSQNVWKYTEQYQKQIEVALDAGLGEGRSAQQLARDVKMNLKDPDRLFRRVRDKRGNLVLSKNAQAFHPGQGVYRSSVKNAQRLTRSEINMAYRESDYLRWQQLDFVVGFEIRRSNHEPLCKCDICKRLVGRYPKWFKFKGWHPQCMCYAVPILMDEETFDDNELGDLKAALHGTTYKKRSAKNAVTDVPDEFKQWVDDHKDKQKDWASVPYFVKDNFVDGDLTKGLKPVDVPKEPTVDPVQEQLDVLMPTIKKARETAVEWGLDVQVSMLDKYVKERNIESIKSRINTITSKATILTNELGNYISDATKTIEEAKKFKNIDVMPVVRHLLAIGNDKSNWTKKGVEYQISLDNLKKAIEAAKVKPASKAKKVKANEEDAVMNEWIEKSKKSEITKSADDEAIEQLYNIKKGVAMTHEEANERRGNPNYREQYISDPDGIYIDRVTKERFSRNPEYKKKYTINCQSCVVAYELRRRGFDVEAIGNTKGSIPEKLSFHTELAWLDENGKVPVAKCTSSEAFWDLDKSMAEVEDMTKTVGRYHIQWTWKKGRWGHIITCERLKNGKLRVYDPQNGEVIENFKEYAKGFRLHRGIKVLRVDNLRLNPDYGGCCVGIKRGK